MNDILFVKGVIRLKEQGCWKVCDLCKDVTLDLNPLLAQRMWMGVDLTMRSLQEVCNPFYPAWESYTGRWE